VETKEGGAGCGRRMACAARMPSAEPACARTLLQCLWVQAASSTHSTHKVRREDREPSLRGCTTAHSLSDLAAPSAAGVTAAACKPAPSRRQRTMPLPVGVGMCLGGALPLSRSVGCKAKPRSAPEALDSQQSACLLMAVTSQPASAVTASHPRDRSDAGEIESALSCTGRVASRDSLFDGSSIASWQRRDARRRRGRAHARRRPGAT
jgi:hypothetical protein